MDHAVVGIAALLAVLYLFRRFRNVVEGKDEPCGCSGCNGHCGNTLSGCDASGPRSPGRTEQAFQTDPE